MPPYIKFPTLSNENCMPCHLLLTISLNIIITFSALCCCHFRNFFRCYIYVYICMYVDTVWRICVVVAFWLLHLLLPHCHCLALIHTRFKRVYANFKQHLFSAWTTKITVKKDTQKFATQAPRSIMLWNCVLLSLPPSLTAYLRLLVTMTLLLNFRCCCCCMKKAIVLLFVCLILFSFF